MKRYELISYISSWICCTQFSRNREAREARTPRNLSGSLRADDNLDSPRHACQPGARQPAKEPILLQHQVSVIILQLLLGHLQCDVERGLTLAAKDRKALTVCLNVPSQEKTEKQGLLACHPFKLLSSAPGCDFFFAFTHFFFLTKAHQRKGSSLWRCSYCTFLVIHLHSVAPAPLNAA